MEVGVTDKLAFHLDMQLPSEKASTTDPCDAAAKAAGKAIQTLREGA